MQATVAETGAKIFNQCWARPPAYYFPVHLGQKLAKSDDIAVDLLQPAHVPAMVHLIATVFSAAEPPAVALGLSVRDLSHFLEMLAPRAVAEGLTVVARSSAGDVVGALLTDDFAVPSAIELPQLSPRFMPIFALLDSLDERYRSTREIREGDYLHLFMLAVDPQFGGRGIAQRMVKRCLENGTCQGYRWAVTEATGVVSQRVFSKLGFEERIRIRYREFSYAGQAVLASIAGHDGAALMDRPID